MGWVPDHHNKASRMHFFFFWFPSTYQSYIYTIQLVNCTVALCLLKCTYLNLKVLYC